jgi:MFS family permease
VDLENDVVMQGLTAASDAQVSASTTRHKRIYQVTVLAMVFAEMLIAAIDRQIFAVVMPQLKAEFGMSDKVVGLVSGLPFALLYAGLSIPIAWLADRRFRRTSLITISLMVWSAMTAFCGLAGGVVVLFLFRMGVGAGESGSGPASLSLVSDYFTGRWRTRAIALCTMGATLGPAVALAAGGWSVAEFGWRTTFFLVGAPGVLFGLLFALLVKEPPRTVAPRYSGHFFSDLVVLLSSKAFLLHFFATGIGLSLLFSISAWIPSYAARTFHAAPKEAGGALALIFGIAGLTAPLLSGWAADHLSSRDERWKLWLCTIMALASCPLFSLAFLSNDKMLFYVFLGGSMFLLAGLMPVILAAGQEIIPPLRSSAVAALMISASLLGHTLGPLYVGTVSDMFAYVAHEQSLRLGLLALSPMAIVAAIAFWGAAKTLPGARRSVQR